jgi:hypothetical protein
VSVIEPTRAPCPECAEVVLIVLVAVIIEGVRQPEKAIIAEPYEWEPRARCYVCQTIETQGKHRASCDRCGGLGFVGYPRPRTPMLAIDVAWSDEGHVRIVGPRTTRRKGEALYALHAHQLG